MYLGPVVGIAIDEQAPQIFGRIRNSLDFLSSIQFNFLVLLITLTI